MDGIAPSTLSEEDVARHVEMINGLLDSGVAWGRVQEYFASREQMLQYAANRLAAKNPFDQPRRGTCCECGGEGQQQLARFTWEYCTNQAPASPMALLELIVGHLPLPSVNRHRFNTHHLFCETCWHKRRTQLRWGTLLQLPGMFLTAAGLMLSIAWGIAYPILLAQQSAGIAEMERIGWMSVPALLIGVPLSIISRKLRVPTSLRHISRRPFQLIRAVVVDGSQSPFAGGTRR